MMSLLEFIAYGIVALFIFIAVIATIQTFQRNKRYDRYLQIVDKHIIQYAEKGHKDTVRKFKELKKMWRMLRSL